MEAAGVGMNNKSTAAVVVDDHHQNNQQDDDMGEAGSMICSDHPFKNNNKSNPGGICAFCLQEKLGKLVSSSFPITIFPSSSSSSPSFRSDHDGLSHGSNIIATSFHHKNGVMGRNGGGGTITSSSSLSLSSSSYINNNNKNGGGNGSRKDCHHHHHQYHSRRARIIPFLLTQKKKKKKELLSSSSSMVATTTTMSASAASTALDSNKNMILKRSKSTTTPRRRRFLDADHDFDHEEDFSPQKRGFWSFFYHTKSTKTIATTTATSAATTSESSAFSQKAKQRDLTSSFPKRGEYNVEEIKDSPTSHGSAGASSSSFERKVSRSRSVGCGSRSFSGDFFERISTGLGDCTLRRVESQREGKSKVPSSTSAAASVGVRGEHHHHHCIKERVKCGGIFGGFIMTSSSSSSSSSSYWMSSSVEDNNGKATSSVPGMGAGSGPVVHGRSRSWGWAFASPIRAFSKTSSNKDGKSNKNSTPNLSAIPSLLSVSG